MTLSTRISRRLCVSGAAAIVGQTLAKRAAAFPVSLAPAWMQTCEELDSLLEKLVDTIDTPALSIGVVIRDQVAAYRGHGQSELPKGMAIDPRTVFRIGSVTKVITGLAVLRLAEDGKLGLDEPIDRWLPELRDVSGGAITLRHIFSHTSGLPRDLPRAYGIGEANLLALASRLRLEMKPGANEAYSNIAVALAGPIVHRASGVPFREYVRSTVLQPLSMNATVWTIDDVPRTRLATGYLKKAPGRSTWQRSLREWKLGSAEAFGGLYSNFSDVSNLIRFVLGYRSGPISAEARVRSLAPAFPRGLSAQSPSQFGFPWHLTPRKVAYHTGTVDEYSACVAVLPEAAIGVIALANTQCNPALELLTLRILDNVRGLTV